MQYAPCHLRIYFWKNSLKCDQFSTFDLLNGGWKKQTHIIPNYGFSWWFSMVESVNKSPKKQNASTTVTTTTVDGWNPANQFIGSLSHYL